MRPSRYDEVSPLLLLRVDASWHVDKLKQEIIRALEAKRILNGSISMHRIRVREFTAQDRLGRILRSTLTSKDGYQMTTESRRLVTQVKCHMPFIHFIGILLYIILDTS